MGRQYNKNNKCIYNPNKLCESPIYKHDLGVCTDFCIPSEGKSWEYQKMNKKSAENLVKESRIDDTD